MLTEDMAIFFDTEELANGVSYTANGASAVAIASKMAWIFRANTSQSCFSEQKTGRDA